jgi:cytochrome b pre-mRNA-processing protein 3
MLSLHLFAVLHRLKGEGGAALGLAQELTDRFSVDMETVLRETGVGDLSIPKKMRGLAASSAALLQAYEEALAVGDTEPLPPPSPRPCRANRAHRRLQAGGWRTI